jgi:catechol 2,3-dioxygenase-like lactoylglutathione lyase family enzyme
VSLLKLAIPLIRVTHVAAAEEFYCNRLGFHREFAHRPEGVTQDPCYIGIARDGVWLHISSFSGDGVSGGVVNLVVDSVDDLHAEFVAKGVPIAIGPVDQTWGTREMYISDADQNSIRFIQQLS